MLTDHCIYTIRHSDELQAVAAGDGRATYTEGKRWVSAKRMVAAAQRLNDRVPIVFAPAEATRYLRAWALLDEVLVGDNTTTYTFSCLRLFNTSPLKTTLRKVSNGKPLDKMFIRPYAICRTPAYLIELHRESCCILGIPVP